MTSYEFPFIGFYFSGVKFFLFKSFSHPLMFVGYDFIICMLIF